MVALFNYRSLTFNETGMVMAEMITFLKTLVAICSCG